MKRRIESIVGRRIRAVRINRLDDLELVDEEGHIIMCICEAMTGNGKVRLPIMTPDGDEFDYSGIPIYRKD